MLLNKTANRLNVERYGGGLWHTFLDRQLVVAGRLLVQGENGVEQILTVSPYNVVIPGVAIHLNPSANENLTLNAQVDFAPLFGQNEQQLYASLTDKTVLDADLYVVPASGSFVAGVNGEFLCSPRLDNLTSVYASLAALNNLQSDNIAVVACLDNEEIGSGTVRLCPSAFNSQLYRAGFAKDCKWTFDDGRTSVCRSRKRNGAFGGQWTRGTPRAPGTCRSGISRVYERRNRYQASRQLFHRRTYCCHTQKHFEQGKRAVSGFVQQKRRAVRLYFGLGYGAHVGHKSL